MNRPLFLMLSSSCAVCLAAAVHAQSADSKTSPSVFTDPAKAEANADTSAPAKPAKPHHDRVMSDQLAATLAVGMPKYDPPKPKPAPLNLPEDAREADKPKNGIVRLPQYDVREKRSPVFTERDLSTPERKADLAYKIHPGLSLSPLASLNRPIATAMYQEQERLENMADLADDARTMRRAGDKATADFISRQSQQTYIQREDSWSTFSNSPK